MFSRKNNVHGYLVASPRETRSVAEVRWHACFRKAEHCRDSRFTITEKRERTNLGQRTRETSETASPCARSNRCDASRQRDSSQLFVRVRPASANLGPCRHARSSARAALPNDRCSWLETFPPAYSPLSLSIGYLRFYEDNGSVQE